MKSITKQILIEIYALTNLLLWKGGTSQILPSTLTKQAELKITSNSKEVLSHLYSTSNKDGSLIAFCSEFFEASGSKTVTVYDVITDQSLITPKQATDLSSLSEEIEGCGFIGQERLLLKEGTSPRVVKSFKVASDGTATVDATNTWTQDMSIFLSNDAFRYNNKNDYYCFINTMDGFSYFGDSSTTTAPSKMSQDLRNAVFSRASGDTFIYGVDQINSYMLIDYSNNLPSTQGSTYDLNTDFGATAGSQIRRAAISQGGASNDRAMIGIVITPNFLGYYDVTQATPSLYGETLPLGGAWDEHYKYSGDANILNLEGSDMFFISGFNDDPSITPLFFVDASDVISGSANLLTIHDVSGELLSGISNPWVSSMSTIGFGNNRYVMSGVEDIEGDGSTWKVPTKGFIVTFSAYFCDPSCKECSAPGNKGCTGCPEGFELKDDDSDGVGECTEKEEGGRGNSTSLNIITSTCGGVEIQGCVQCERDLPYCQSCQRGGGLDEMTNRGTGAKCVICPVANCMDCEIASNGKRNCQKCFDGYKLKFKDDTQECTFIDIFRMGVLMSSLIFIWIR